MIGDFVTKPLQGALFRKFRHQIMDMILAQDPGPGKSQTGKARPVKAQPGKVNPKKGKEYFFKFGPTGRAATHECVGRSFRRVRWTDARTLDILGFHIHAIVIRWDDGCIGIHQLLTATLFIVPNSLLPFNLEENILRAS